MRKSTIRARCPRGTVIQSLLLATDGFRTVRSARAWVTRHGFKAPKVDTTDRYHRFRQRPPAQFRKGSFRTIKLTDNVKAVVGCPKAKRARRNAIKWTWDASRGAWHAKSGRWNAYVYRSHGRRRGTYDWSAIGPRHVKQGNARTADAAKRAAAAVFGARTNPDLLILTTNPDAPPAPASWGTFHLRDASNARMVNIPDVRGLPQQVVALGGFEGVEMSNGRGKPKQVLLGWREDRGPWLVTDTAMKRLWVVAGPGASLARLAPWYGKRSSAVYYFPPETSGKHDSARGFRHAWGDGTLPERRWPEVWPRLVAVGDGKRAARFTGGRFYITADGIVG